jgi:acetoin utilization protein AcuB
MLLVEDSMTREVVTLSPETTAGDALALCREMRIRHLPVVVEGELVGMVSDRDLRLATPALGDPARSEALERIRVHEVMSTNVLTARPEDPIEVAANTMRERRIGCLPVVGDGGMVGIISSSDVMEALVYLVGAHEPGSRMVVAIPDRPGALAGAAGVFGICDVNIVSVVAGPVSESLPGERLAVFRIDTINPGETVERLGEAGYTVLWPPPETAPA